MSHPFLVQTEELLVCFLTSYKSLRVCSLSLSAHNNLKSC